MYPCWDQLRPVLVPFLADYGVLWGIFLSNCVERGFRRFMYVVYSPTARTGRTHADPNIRLGRESTRQEGEGTGRRVRRGKIEITKNRGGNF